MRGYNNEVVGLKKKMRKKKKKKILKFPDEGDSMHDRAIIIEKPTIEKIVSHLHKFHKVYVFYFKLH